jgi:hypothetical protein
VRDPHHRPSQRPRDPGQIGRAPGHIRQINIAGALLIAATGARFFGFMMLFGDERSALGPLVLIASSVMFVLTGLTALGRPGRLRASGAAYAAQVALFLAEAAAVAAALGYLLIPSSYPDPGDILVQAVMPLHALLLAGAAGGLLVHLRALLRPGAWMRRGTTALMAVVIILLLTWSLAIPLEAHAMLLAMLPLPPLAVIVGMAMIWQRELPRAQAMHAVEETLTQLRAELGEPTSLPDGARWSGHLGERALSVRLDDARLPVGVEVRLTLAPSLLSLKLTRRSGPAGVPTGDMMLDRLVEVGGVSAAEAAALLSEQHGPVLSVTDGRPGSGVRDGQVIVCGALSGRSSVMAVHQESQKRELGALVHALVTDAAALADALESRQQVVRTRTAPRAKLTE